MSKKRAPSNGHDGDYVRAHSLWSGTLSFGLVTIPVALFPANRSGRVGLRMLDQDGTPLARRWCCPKEKKLIENDELVRGYPVGDDKHVIVTDDELAALAPRKSRDIDLRRFVKREELDPSLFERGYFLAPASESTKAYRLLAEVMEETGRAGVATFVMRDQEYLVAILAQNGVLSAETMRFADELRSPATIGLPARRPQVERAAVRRFARAIAAHAADKLDRRELEDDHAEGLLELVERKHKRGDDVVERPELAAAAEPHAEIIDLMEVLKQSLGVEGGRRAGPKRAGAPGSSGAGDRTSGRANGRKTPARRAGGKR
jgi:DNA end-binding protein Ku